MTEPIAADDPRWEELRAPFPVTAISKMPRVTCADCRRSPRKRCDTHTWVGRCPECGTGHTSAAIHLDYVGHADVTARLDEVDPHWNWEPAYRDTDPHLLSAAIATGNPELARLVIDSAPAKPTDGGLWIRLTVLGVTRLGFGDADGKTGTNAVKEVIGDAIRNAAMRFGVATYLWSKSEAAQALKDGPEDTQDGSQEPEPQRPASPPRQARQRPQQAQKATQTAQAIAEAAARTAAGIGNEHDLAELRGKTQQSCGPLNVRPVVSDDELQAAASYYAVLNHPRTADHLPLWGWLDACAAVIKQNGTSVRDAVALARGEPAPAP